MTNAAYIDGLKMLARRELSEAQVRQRLVRKGHGPTEIDEAIGRLREGRAIDDARTAAAIARTEITLKRRGKLRVKRTIEQAGISPGTARMTVDEIFSTVDHESLLESSLAVRLRGREQIRDDREFRRLYRYLVSQGFEQDTIVKALRARRAPRDAAGAVDSGGGHHR